MTEPSTEAENKYLNQGGTNCPHCGEQDLEACEMNAGIGIAWQSMRCNICEGEWTDTYTLTGITLK